MQEPSQCRSQRKRWSCTISENTPCATPIQLISLQETSTSVLSRCASTPASKFQCLQSPASSTHKTLQFGCAPDRCKSASRSSCEYIDTSHINPFQSTFTSAQLVDEGGFGKIYKCLSKTDGRWYAIKHEQFWFTAKAYFNPSQIRDVLMNEALTLARLDHENVCRYYNTWVLGSIVSSEKVGCKGAHAESPQCSLYTTTQSSKLPSIEYRSDCDSIGVSAFDDLAERQSLDFADLGFDMPQVDFDEGGDVTDTVSRTAYERPNAHCNIESNFNKSSCGVNSRYCVPARPFCTQIDVYIQMALYEGRSLQHWLNERKVVNPVESLNIFRQIVSGIKYIHSQGLLHRDIKPANIFLTKQSCVKIGDFGLAKNSLQCNLNLDPSQYVLDDNSLLGSTGVGTPLYSSPEQLTKNSSFCNASTDIFSLGMVLYELYYVFSTQMERQIVLANVRKGILQSDFISKYPLVASLVEKLVQCDSSKRPTCNYIEAHPLLTGGYTYEKQSSVAIMNTLKLHHDISPSSLIEHMQVLSDIEHKYQIALNNFEQDYEILFSKGQDPSSPQEETANENIYQQDSNFVHYQKPSKIHLQDNEHDFGGNDNYAELQTPYINTITKLKQNHYERMVSLQNLMKDFQIDFNKKKSFTVS